MKNIPDIQTMNDKILKIKTLLEELDSDADFFPALSRNSKRALASIKMLELNICDIISFNLD
ncbi:MAG: hypothetical protein L3J69_14825 [Desulfobacula sp.]|nr:hypothetical protein [Desulfobacula sp.]